MTGTPPIRVPSPATIYRLQWVTKLRADQREHQEELKSMGERVAALENCVQMLQTSSDAVAARLDEMASTMESVREQLAAKQDPNRPYPTHEQHHAGNTVATAIEFEEAAMPLPASEATTRATTVEQGDAAQMGDLPVVVSQRVLWPRQSTSPSKVTGPAVQPATEPELEIEQTHAQSPKAEDAEEQPGEPLETGERRTRARARRSGKARSKAKKKRAPSPVKDGESAKRVRVRGAVPPRSERIETRSRGRPSCAGLPLY